VEKEQGTNGSDECKEDDVSVKNTPESVEDNLVEIGDAEELAEDGNVESIPTSGQDAADMPNRPEKGFFGQVVSRRHPLLIILVLLFAFFLAVAPLLFRYQKSAMTDALEIYQALCQKTTSDRITDDWMKSISGPDLLRLRSSDREAFFRSVQCVDLGQYKTALRPLKGRQFGANRAYVLSIHQGSDVVEAEKKGMPVINLFFPVVNEELKIDVMPVSR